MEAAQDCGQWLASLLEVLNLRKPSEGLVSYLVLRSAHQITCIRCTCTKFGFDLAI
jgi:hypothetical protein